MRKARCYYPHETPKPVSDRWFPFCSMRCAAEHGIGMTEAQQYCATCDQWDEFSEYHPHPVISEFQGVIKTRGGQ